MELELRHLRAVCAVADAGSITKAAVTLGTTQPALTAQLQRIERGLGGQLFQRQAYGVRPTPFGQFFLYRARIVLSAADDLRRGALSWHAEAARPPLRLGGIAGPVVIGLAGKLTRELHATEVQVRTEPAPRLLVDLVASGQLDLAVVVDYPSWETCPPPGVQLCELVSEPVFVALPVSHPQAGQPEINLGSLAADTWVLTPPDGAGWPESFEAACQRAGFEPRVGHRIAELRPTHELIATGKAVSPCQATFEPSAGIVVRPLAGDPLWMRHLLAWQTGSTLAARSADLVAWALAAYQADAQRSAALCAWRKLRTPGD
ncbi:LysR family transcriptional regulator [Longispora albida]|uniref:LysR family transcriptional regulator n=1 Tax=Longispora albida TaxID=203523 RepID=UPI0003A44356|nr:LysR family transcriptional regulator [Longispora albida]